MRQTVAIDLTVNELRILNNSLNEACNGIDLQGEFETRMGCTRGEGIELLKKIRALLEAPNE